MIELHGLRRAREDRRKRKRVGRGPGSGSGKTSGRGAKGQNSRSGGGVPAWFEGGQMPLQRRIPKRGFKNRNRTRHQAVNVGDLHVLEGRAATPETLRETGLAGSSRLPIKLLAGGDAPGSIQCSVHAASAAARRKIEDAGGSVTIVSKDG